MVGLDANIITRSAQQHEEMSSGHLNLAYNHWMTLPFDVQRDQWQLEIIRAFAREKERRKSTDEQLLRAQGEANQLLGQVTRLSSCQWPREFALFPPDLLPLPRDVVRELEDKGEVLSPHSARWDYDNLVAKWTRVVMHDRGMGRSNSNNNNNNDNNNNNNNSGTEQGKSGLLEDNAPLLHPERPSSAPSLPGARRPVGRPPLKRPRLMNGTQMGEGSQEAQRHDASRDIT